MDWLRVDGMDQIFPKSDLAEGGTLDIITPLTVSFVGIPDRRPWYNKLSSLGDYDGRYPKPFTKLKWILHVNALVDTIFASDWDHGIAALQSLEHRTATTEPRDMVIKSGPKEFKVYFTANMFKRKVTAI